MLVWAFELQTVWPQDITHVRFYLSCVSTHWTVWATKNKQTAVNQTPNKRFCSEQTENKDRGVFLSRRPQTRLQSPCSSTTALLLILKKSHECFKGFQHSLWCVFIPSYQSIRAINPVSKGAGFCTTNCAGGCRWVHALWGSWHTVRMYWQHW